MSDLRYTRPNRFPPIVKNLLIINVLVFFAASTFETSFDFYGRLALHDVRSVFFEPYQIVTHMFMHANFEHLLFNMFALWMFGALLENVWGPKRFLIFYLACGLGAALLHMITLYVELTPIFERLKSAPIDMQLDLIKDPGFKGNGATVGASGAVFGLLAAFGYLFPNSIVYIFFAIPMKAKWFVIIYGAIELMLAVRNAPGDSVAHFAHLGGAITGFILVYIWNKTNRRTLY